MKASLSGFRLRNPDPHPPPLRGGPPSPKGRFLRVQDGGQTFPWGCCRGRRIFPFKISHKLCFGKNEKEKKKKFSPSLVRLRVIDTRPLTLSLSLSHSLSRSLSPSLSRSLSRSRYFISPPRYFLKEGHKKLPDGSWIRPGVWGTFYNF